LSQDEARFPMVPTLTATLGVKGHRPVVGTRDCKDLLYAFASVDCVTGRLRTRTLECRAADARKAREGKPGRVGRSKTRRLQEAFAGHLRDVAKAYPAHRHRRVMLVIDNAPWHRGKVVGEALAANPHLELYRLPSYSPRLAVIERFWKVLRRRATHNRLFDTLKDLKASLHNSLRYFHTVRSRIMSLIGDCYANATASAGT
jgi:transposase